MNRPFAIAVDVDGNVYVTGESYTSTQLDYATIKYNAAGIGQWAVCYNGTANSSDGALLHLSVIRF